MLLLLRFASFITTPYTNTRALTTTCSINISTHIPQRARERKRNFTRARGTAEFSPHQTKSDIQRTMRRKKKPYRKEGDSHLRVSLWEWIGLWGEGGEKFFFSSLASFFFRQMGRDDDALSRSRTTYAKWKEFVSLASAAFFGILILRSF